MITYNHQDYIAQAIKSILSQITNFDFELIISNDCSTDNSHEVISKVIESNNKSVKIKYFNHIKNLGIHENFKHVHSMATGEYMAICEGDDYWVDDCKLQKQIDFLDKYKDYSLCYTRFKTFYEKTKAFALDLNEEHFINNETAIEFNFKTLQKGWHIGNQTLVFRNSHFDYSVYLKYESVRDIHVLTHLLKNGKGKCLNFIGAVYRVHPSGIHSSATVYEGFKKGYECHKEIYLNNKGNQILKGRYLHSFQNFIRANIKEKKLLKAALLSVELFFLQMSVMSLLKNFRQILKIYS